MILTYKATPEVSCLRGNILSQTDVLVGVNNGISSKVEPTVLKIMV